MNNVNNQLSKVNNKLLCSGNITVWCIEFKNSENSITVKTTVNNLRNIK